MQRKVTPQVDPVIHGVTESSESAKDMVRDQLKLGDEAAKRGEIVSFDPDAIKQSGRERLKQHGTDAR